MSPNNVITHEHEPESPTTPPDLVALAAKLDRLSRQIDSLFGNDTDLRQLFFERFFPLIHETEERKIG